jgi:hypothetical protein
MEELRTSQRPATKTIATKTALASTAYEAAIGSIAQLSGPMAPARAASLSTVSHSLIPNFTRHAVACAGGLMLITLGVVKKPKRTGIAARPTKQ